jgi:hypothetical protein
MQRPEFIQRKGIMQTGQVAGNIQLGNLSKAGLLKKQGKA